MNKKKIENYLKVRGLTYWGKNGNCWFDKDGKCNFFKFLKDNGYGTGTTDRWDGWGCGYLKFAKSKSGRRYIQFLPGRCYID